MGHSHRTPQGPRARPARHRRRSRAGGLLAGVVWAACAAGIPALAAAQDSSYETDTPVALDQVLPESVIASGQHRVTSARRAGGPRLVFDIESEVAGSQLAESIPLALIRIQEAQTLSQAVNQFRRDTRARADENRGQIRIGGDSLAEIIGSPLDTSAKVVGQFGRNVGQTLDELGEFPGPETDRDPAEGDRPFDPIFESHRRSVAGQLGLDVHSSNPRVQRFLNAMAHARAGGQTRAGITTVSLTRPPEVLVGRGSVQDRIRSSVLNEERGELFQRNAARLEDAGVGGERVSRLLEHRVLTPTHKASITEYIVYMEGVRNRGALVAAALDARDEVEALAKVQMVRMYARYHESVDSLREFIEAGHLALALSRNGGLLVALPFDVLEWNADSDRVFTALAAFSQDKGVTSRTVLLSGVVTESARAALEQRGFQVRDRYLFRG